MATIPKSLHEKILIVFTKNSIPIYNRSGKLNLFYAEALQKGIETLLNDKEFLNNFKIFK